MPKSKNRKKKGVQPSSLSAHKRDRKVLQAPMNQLGGTRQLSSWVNEVLPEMLWAVLLVNALPRNEYLARFKTLIDYVEKNKERFKDHRLDHTSLSKIDVDVFEGLFADLSRDEKLAPVLACCGVLETLPGVDRWKKLLPQPETDEGRIQDAVAASYDHVGEKATDLRWLRVMIEIVRDKFVFAPEMAHRLKNVVEFPESKKPDKDGGPVRALEMATRGNAEGNGAKVWADAFWKTALEQTECIPSNPDEDREVAKYEALGKEVLNLYEELVKHFRGTLKATVADPRHEGAFGLSFYIMHLAFLALNASVGQTVQGRLVLRAAVETLIILIWLARKDDAVIWLQYRNYGASQAKLAFLKFNEEDAPAFVTKDLLESLANADLWMEYQDIKLGAWADKNLRDMAIEADAKDLYDKYYDTLSGYAHGNWAAVSHSTFGLCLNPLHRFHRIPLPPRFFVEDAAPDMVKLINLALEQVTQLYPPFKPRLKLQADQKEVA